MANPNQARDSRGRFARFGGNATEDRRDSKEREADRKRVEKAKIAAQIADVRDSLSTVVREEQSLINQRPTRKSDPHEVVDYERERAFLRERKRVLKQKLRELGHRRQ